MSLALIQECAKEARRLAIAGSSLAVGDFRLKKIAAPLEQAGAKVPVFAQVAKSITDLVNGTEANSAANLLSLSTLLNAILYTQGKSGADGEFSAIELLPMKCASTRTPARILKPLVQALTTSGSGRFETVKAAVERGAFNDLRLIAPAIDALGDGFPELAELVAEKVLPAYGTGIIPQLKTGFEIKGKKQDARRLHVMHRLDPDGTLELCKTALDDGSPEVKATALSCLGAHPECLPLVLEQANAKNKVVRAAALETLAAHPSGDVTKLFIELIAGKSLESLVVPFRTMKNDDVLNALLAEGRRDFKLALDGDAEQLTRIYEVLSCLEYRKESAVLDFMLEHFENTVKIAKLKAAKNAHLSGEDLVVQLTHHIYRSDTAKGRDAILGKQHALPSSLFSLVLRCAVQQWSEADVFTKFSPLLKAKGAAEKSKTDELENLISAAGGDPDFFNDSDEAESREKRGFDFTKVAWDSRWLDAAIDAGNESIACSLARRGHNAATEFLVALTDAKKIENAAQIVRALARCGYPQVTDVFIKLASRAAKSAKYLNYEFIMVVTTVKLLPKADLPKLETYAATLSTVFMDCLVGALASLRTANNPN